jgi:hypothetical protein
MNALIWVPPAYHTTGDPVGGLPPPTTGPINQPVSVLTPPQNARPRMIRGPNTTKQTIQPRVYLEGASTSQVGFQEHPLSPKS